MMDFPPSRARRCKIVSRCARCLEECALESKGNWDGRKITCATSSEREREREDFRQETGSDSVNRGIPGRGLLFEFKAKLHFSGYFKKFRI